MASLGADRSEWFGAERARAWAVVLGVVSAVALAGLVIATRSGTVPDPWGRPLAPDFSSFWVASRLALAGSCGVGVGPGAAWGAQREYFPVEAGYLDDYYGFFYPPPFLVLLLPLGVLPYGAAIRVWIGGTGAAYLMALRRLVGACLGIMVVKPHVALLILPALLAARRFRAAGFMAIGMGVLCLVSWGCWGRRAGGGSCAMAASR